MGKDRRNDRRFPDARSTSDADDPRIATKPVQPAKRVDKPIASFGNKRDHTRKRPPVTSQSIIDQSVCIHSPTLEGAKENGCQPGSYSAA
jgi:hypothetical protein